MSKKYSCMILNIGKGNIFVIFYRIVCCFVLSKTVSFCFVLFFPVGGQNALWECCYYISAQPTISYFKQTQTSWNYEVFLQGSCFQVYLFPFPLSNLHFPLSSWGILCDIYTPLDVCLFKFSHGFFQDFLNCSLITNREARLVRDRNHYKQNLKNPSILVIQIYVCYWYQKRSEQLGWIHVKQSTRLTSDN